jgi:hypothetical protein
MKGNWPATRLLSEDETMQRSPPTSVVKENTTRAAADLLNEVRVLLNQELLKAEDRLRSLMATADGDGRGATGPAGPRAT